MEGQCNLLLFYYSCTVISQVNMKELVGAIFYCLGLFFNKFDTVFWKGNSYNEKSGNTKLHNYSITRFLDIQYYVKIFLIIISYLLFVYY